MKDHLMNLYKKFHKKIQIQKLITPNYLSRIFKKSIKISIIMEKLILKFPLCSKNEYFYTWIILKD